MREESSQVTVADPAVAADTGGNQTVLYESRETGVAVLTLNRPERMNAWGGGVESAFWSGLDRAEAEPDVRTVVITGSGRANCAPSSLAVIKQQVYADTMRDMFGASAVAEKLMHESMLRPDFIEGITSFFEKRPPKFPPLGDRRD
jgi:enoyl-CoA hydratase/carnithine racemase